MTAFAGACYIKELPMMKNELLRSASPVPRPAAAFPRPAVRTGAGACP